MSLRWYVFQTKPQAEFFAEWQLNRQKFSTHVPFETIDKKRLGVVYKQEKRALFRTYGFVQFDISIDPWKKICSTYGVKRLFSADVVTPIPVPEGIVEKLMELPVEEQEVVVEPIEPVPIVQYNEGETLIVDGGHWQNCVGICSYSDDARITLLMQIMSSEVRVTFKRSNMKNVTLTKVEEDVKHYGERYIQSPSPDKRVRIR